MAETVLVTGGTGFIGGWAVVELLRRGYDVRTTVRSLGKTEALRASIAAQGVDTTRLSFAAADLMSDEGWDAAVSGCDFVLHVASPLGGAVPNADRYALVPPARDGTLRVLRAAVKGGVKRVVMTSAAATARRPLRLNVVSDETMWADPDDKQFDAYRVSKILAERAAWDFMKEHGGATEFATILPGAVYGPVMSRDAIGSVRIIHGLLNGRPPAVPRLGFWVVDVRDLVDAHIRAMITPAAAGERFIVAGDFMWMEEMARTLRERLGARGAKAPTRHLPSWLVRLMLPVAPQFRSLAPMLDRRFALTSEKARRVLGMTTRPAAETVVDCAVSLLALAR
jgi:dihydroflavonol-4-reductase